MGYNDISKRRLARIVAECAAEVVGRVMSSPLFEDGPDSAPSRPSVRERYILEVPGGNFDYGCYVDPTLPRTKRTGLDTGDLMCDLVDITGGDVEDMRPLMPWESGYREGYVMYSVNTDDQVRLGALAARYGGVFRKA